MIQEQQTPNYPHSHHADSKLPPYQVSRQTSFARCQWLMFAKLYNPQECPLPADSSQSPQDNSSPSVLSRATSTVTARLTMSATSATLCFAASDVIEPLRDALVAHLSREVAGRSGSGEQECEHFRSSYTNWRICATRPWDSCNNRPSRSAGS